MKIRTLIPIPVLLIGILPCLGQQTDWIDKGLTLQKKSTTVSAVSGEEESSTSTMFLDSSSIREVRSDGLELVILPGEKRLITISHLEKAYSEVSLDEFKETFGEVSEKLSEEAVEQEKTMEMLHKALGGKPGNVTLEVLGPGEKIAGFETVKYRMNMAPLQMEIWAAPAIRIPDLYYDMLMIYSQPNPLFDMQQIFDRFKEIDGLSLKTRVTIKVMGIDHYSLDEVIAVQTGPVAPYSIPAGYEKIELTY